MTTNTLAPFDPLQAALDDMGLRHRAEVRRITARAREFGDVAATLAALMAAGLQITIRSATVMPVGDKEAAGSILVVASGPASARTPASMEILCGPHLQPKLVHLPMFEQHSTVWRHPANWLLLIHWVPADQADIAPATALAA